MSSRSYFTRYAENVPSFKVRHDFFKNSFFPSTATEWNKIDKNIRKSESLNIFKKSILKFIRPSQNRVYNCHNPKGIKLLTRLRVGLSHLREHKFKHSFQDTLNPICTCGEDIETTSHYLLHCPDYLEERKTLLNTISCIVPNIFDFNNDQLTEILLYGKDDLDNINNTSILDATINYLIETKRFTMHSFFDALLIHGFDIDVAFKIHIFVLFFSFCFIIFIFLLLFRFSFFLYFIGISFLFPGISQHIYVYLVIANFFGLMCRC